MEEFTFIERTLTYFMMFFFFTVMVVLPVSVLFFRVKKWLKIRSTILLLCLICLANLSYAQEKVKIITSENTQLVKVLNNSELIVEDITGKIAVRIYKVHNEIGSAGFEESHEVSHNLLIAVSEIDEYPRQKLFEIGPFYNPKFLKWGEDNKPYKEFEIEYGVYGNRKTVKLKVNINELKMD